MAKVVSDVSSVVSDEPPVPDAEPSLIVPLEEEEEAGEGGDEDVEGEAEAVKLLVEGPPTSTHAWSQLSMMSPRPSLKKTRNKVGVGVVE